MIIKTTKNINGIIYSYTYSDMGMKIERDGALYDEAIDPIDSGREYTETDMPIENEEIGEEIPAEELKSMIEGVL